jgi:hypothetical protein
MILLDGPPQPARLTNRSFVYANCPGESSGCSVTGARIEAQFEAAPLARAVRRLVVAWNQQELASVTVDFSALE